MKQRLLLISLLLGLIINSGCLKFFHKSSTKEQPSVFKERNLELHNHLQVISSYLEFAESQQNEYDTITVEFYYDSALKMLDSLNSSYGQDSAFVEMYIKVIDSYDEYLSRIVRLERDTLSADQVMQDLNTIYASESDSLNVTPTDSMINRENMSIPIEMNRKVEKAIQYFTEHRRGRIVMNHWLERAGRYKKMVQKILREEGAPEELFYLAMIESGFNPRARSYARAVGMWQFISATGRAYGLDHSWWFDERRDPVKATRAAARHLLDLYERFGDWYLAIAGYNFNPGKIEYRLAKYNVDKYWDLPRLPRQTRNYVPTFLAAITIANDTDKYGFDITPEAPLEFDTVTVEECVDLNIVAECVGSSFAKLKELNPALYRWCTPPDRDEWMLYLPKDTRDTFMVNYAKVPEEKKISWKHHRIRYGETLSTIAHRYGVSISEIKRFNKIRGSLIRAGHHLVIPVPQNEQYYRKHITSPRSYRTRQSHRQKPVETVPGREKLVYTVKQGDSFWDIAQKFDVSVGQIKKWNGWGYSGLIKPGQKLNIWLLPGQNKITEDGETILAQKTHPAEIVSPNSSFESESTIHTVRYGDTLWDIAKMYNVSIGDIKKWNGKRGNKIRPGDKLKILRK